LADEKLVLPTTCLMSPCGKCDIPLHSNSGHIWISHSTLALSNKFGRQRRNKKTKKRRLRKNYLRYKDKGSQLGPNVRSSNKIIVTMRDYYS
jgi:hypothetical protein